MNPRTYVFIAIVVVVIVAVIFLIQTRKEHIETLVSCDARMAYNGMFNKLLTESTHWTFTYMLLNSIIKQDPTDSSLEKKLQPYIEDAQKRASKNWSLFLQYYSIAIQYQPSDLGNILSQVFREAENHIKNNIPINLTKYSFGIGESLTKDGHGPLDQTKESVSEYIQKWENIHSLLISGNASGAYLIFDEIEQKSMEMSNYLSNMAAYSDTIKNN